MEFHQISPNLAIKNVNNNIGIIVHVYLSNDFNSALFSSSPNLVASAGNPAILSQKSNSLAAL